MSLEVAIQQKLLADPGFAALVKEESISTGDMPTDAAYPQVLMYCLEDTPTESMEGHSGENHPIYRFDVWSPSLEEVKKIRKAIMRILLGLHEVITLPDGEEVNIYGINWSGGRYSSYQDTEKLHGWEIELDISYLEDLEDGGA